MLIQATTIDLSTTNDIVMVGFVNMETAVPNYLVFQRPLDIPNSHYYLEVDNQLYSSYGGIKHLLLSRNKLHLELEEALLQRLNTFGLSLEYITVQFTCSAKQFRQLRQKLQQIFHGHACYHEFLDGS